MIKSDYFLKIHESCSRTWGAKPTEMLFKSRGLWEEVTAEKIFQEFVSFASLQGLSGLNSCKQIFDDLIVKKHPGPCGRNHSLGAFKIALLNLVNQCLAKDLR